MTPYINNHNHILDMIVNKNAYSDHTKGRWSSHRYRWVDLRAATLARAAEEDWTVDVSFGVERGSVFNLRAEQIYTRTNQPVPCTVAPDQKQITIYPTFIDGLR